MGKAIGRIDKHGQSQVSTQSIKEPVLSCSAYETSSSTVLTKTLVSSDIDKEQTNSVLCSQNTI